MNEEEAFIRAIVDTPGDDVARLVYADWLDDRADPRGPFLRAEHEWAKPWRAGERPAESAELRKLAAGLDAVWVARVSRPPVGVCCDHVRFTERGPTLAPPDLDALEFRIRGELPSDFRAFLLDTNGGLPTPGFCLDPHSAERDGPLTLELGSFYVACRTGEYHPPEANSSWSLDIESQRAWLEELSIEGGNVGPNPLIAGMIPLTDVPHSLGYMLLRVVGPQSGQVCYFRDYCHRNDTAENLEDFVPTFSELLARLGPDQDN